MKSGNSYKISAHRLNLKFLESLSHPEKEAFAFLSLLKCNFTNSYIYQYNPTRLSNKLGTVSRYHVNRLVKMILQFRWGYIDSNGHLFLRSFKWITGDFTFYKTTNYYIKLESTDSMQDVMDKINTEILRHNLKRQEDRIDTKRYLRLSNNGLPIPRSKYNKIKKLVKSKQPSKFRQIDGAFVNFCVMGMRRLSTILKCSVNQAIAFLNRLKGKGIVATKKIMRKVVFEYKPKRFRNIHEDYYDYQRGFRFSIGFVEFQYLGTKITLLT